MKSLFLCLLLLLSCILHAQQANFQRLYKMDASSFGSHVIPRPDGSHVLFGFSRETGGEYRSVSIVKINSTGLPLWKKNYRMPGPALINYITDVYAMEMPDSGFVLAWNYYHETPSSSVSYMNVHLMRMDAAGNILWHRSIYSMSIEDLQCYSIIQTADKGFLLSGDRLYKTDSTGNLQWRKKVSNVMFLETLAAGVDGFISLGRLGGSLFLYRSDNMGNLIWAKTLSGVTWIDDPAGFRLVNNGFTIAGYYYDSVATKKLLLIRTDTSGNLLWSKGYDAPDPAIALAFDVTTEGGYIVAGAATVTTTGKTLSYLLKTDTSGNPLWAKTYGNNGYNGFADVKQHLSGGYIAIGHYDTAASYKFKMHVVSTDSSGNSGCLENSWPVSANNLSITVNNNPVISYPFQYTLSTNTGNSTITATGISTPLCPSCTSSFPLIISANGPASFCQGDYVQLSVDTGFVNYLWSNNDDSSGIVVNTSGNYSVTITDSNGCTATATPVTITVHPLPAVPVITATGNTLTSSIAAGNQWYLNWNSIPGATAQNYTATQTGYYNVIVTDSNDCFSTSIAYYFSLGTEELSVKNEISIYPNPANGDFIFKTAEPGMLSIINMQGQIINRYQVIKGNNEIKMPDVSAGIYLGSFRKSGEKGKPAMLRIIYQP